MCLSNDTARRRQSEGPLGESHSRLNIFVFNCLFFKMFFFEVFVFLFAFAKCIFASALSIGSF